MAGPSVEHERARFGRKRCRLSLAVENDFDADRGTERDRLLDSLDPENEQRPAVHAMVERMLDLSEAGHVDEKVSQSGQQVAAFGGGRRRYAERVEHALKLVD